MVIKKLLEATEGKRKTRSLASLRSIPSVLNDWRTKSSRSKLRSIFGGLPNSRSMGRSTGALPKCSSLTVKCSSFVASPSTA